MHAPAHTSQDSDSEFPTKVVSKSRKHQYFHSLPKRPKLRRLFANQNDKGSLQKTHWRSSTSSKKQGGDLITADHKVLNEESESRRQSPVRCRCSKSCHSVDSILPVQNEVFTGDGKEFTKVPRAVSEDLSWNHCTSTPHRSQTSGITETAARGGKKELQPYCYNQDWMKDGGLFLFIGVWQSL